MDGTPGDITQLLAQVQTGDREAESRLFDLVESELHVVAQRFMRRERPDHTLQATALVNEVYLKLVDENRDWQNRAHFLAVAARAMRQILMDHARRRLATKRNGGVRMELDKAGVCVETHPEKLLTLDQALSRLADWDERQSRVVEMRFFGGLTEEEIAAVLGVSSKTVKRDWSLARAWLHEQIEP